MYIFPAIDLYDNKVVRLYKGDYNQITVYNDDAVAVARQFEAQGAEYLHIVDLNGAKVGAPCAYDTVKRIASATSLKIEIGGGVRTFDAVNKYASLGVDRVILGTAAVKNNLFLTQAADKYVDIIAVGIDIKDGNVAINGWTECKDISCEEMFERVCGLGISRVICTDISKDGAMIGTNRNLYASLSKCFNTDIIASGGVSSMDDVIALRDMGIFGAIIGKAYYTGAINISDAIMVCKNDK